MPNDVWIGFEDLGDSEIKSTDKYTVEEINLMQKEEQTEWENKKEEIKNSSTPFGYVKNSVKNMFKTPNRKKKQDELLLNEEFNKLEIADDVLTEVEGSKKIIDSADELTTTWGSFLKGIEGTIENVSEELSEAGEDDSQLFDVILSSLTVGTSILNKFLLGIPLTIYKTGKQVDLTHQNQIILKQTVESGWKRFIEGDALLRYLNNSPEIKFCNMGKMENYRQKLDYALTDLSNELKLNIQKDKRLFLNSVQLLNNMFGKEFPNQAFAENNTTRELQITQWLKKFTIQFKDNGIPVIVNRFIIYAYVDSMPLTENYHDINLLDSTKSADINNQAVNDVYKALNFNKVWNEQVSKSKYDHMNLYMDDINMHIEWLRRKWSLHSLPTEKNIEFSELDTRKGFSGKFKECTHKGRILCGGDFEGLDGWSTPDDVGAAWRKEISYVTKNIDQLQSNIQKRFDSINFESSNDSDINFEDKWKNILTDAKTTACFEVPGNTNWMNDKLCEKAIQDLKFNAFKKQMETKYNENILKEQYRMNNIKQKAIHKKELEFLYEMKSKFEPVYTDKYFEINMKKIANKLANDALSGVLKSRLQFHIDVNLIYCKFVNIGENYQKLSHVALNKPWQLSEEYKEIMHTNKQKIYDALNWAWEKHFQNFEFNTRLKAVLDSYKKVSELHRPKNLAALMPGLGDSQAENVKDLFEYIFYILIKDEQRWKRNDNLNRTQWWVDILPLHLRQEPILTYFKRQWIMDKFEINIRQFCKSFVRYAKEENSEQNLQKKLPFFNNNPAFRNSHVHPNVILKMTQYQLRQYLYEKFPFVSPTVEFSFDDKKSHFVILDDILEIKSKMSILIDEHFEEARQRAGIHIDKPRMNEHNISVMMRSSGDVCKNQKVFNGTSNNGERAEFLRLAESPCSYTSWHDPQRSISYVRENFGLQVKDESNYFMVDDTEFDKAFLEVISPTDANELESPPFKKMCGNLFHSGQEYERYKRMYEFLFKIWRYVIQPYSYLFFGSSFIPPWNSELSEFGNMIFNCFNHGISKKVVSKIYLEITQQLRFKTPSTPISTWADVLIYAEEVSTKFNEREMTAQLSGKNTKRYASRFWKKLKNIYYRSDPALITRQLAVKMNKVNNIKMEILTQIVLENDNYCKPVPFIPDLSNTYAKNNIQGGISYVNQNRAKIKSKKPPHRVKRDSKTMPELTLINYPQSFVNSKSPKFFKRRENHLYSIPNNKKIHRSPISVEKSKQFPIKEPILPPSTQHNKNTHRSPKPVKRGGKFPIKSRNLPASTQHNQITQCISPYAKGCAQTLSRSPIDITGGTSLLLNPIRKLFTHLDMLKDNKNVLNLPEEKIIDKLYEDITFENEYNNLDYNKYIETSINTQIEKLENKKQIFVNNQNANKTPRQGSIHLPEYYSTFQASETSPYFTQIANLSADMNVNQDFLCLTSMLLHNLAVLQMIWEVNKMFVDGIKIVDPDSRISFPKRFSNHSFSTDNIEKSINIFSDQITTFLGKSLHIENKLQLNSNEENSTLSRTFLLFEEIHNWLETSNSYHRTSLRKTTGKKINNWILDNIPIVPSDTNNNSDYNSFIMNFTNAMPSDDVLKYHKTFTNVNDSVNMGATKYEVQCDFIPNINGIYTSIGRIWSTAWGAGQSVAAFKNSAGLLIVCRDNGQCGIYTDKTMKNWYAKAQQLNSELIGTPPQSQEWEVYLSSKKSWVRGILDIQPLHHVDYDVNNPEPMKLPPTRQTRDFILAHEKAETWCSVIEKYANFIKTNWLIRYRILLDTTDICEDPELGGLFNKISKHEIMNPEPPIAKSTSNFSANDQVYVSHKKTLEIGGDTLEYDIWKIEPVTVKSVDISKKIYPNEKAFLRLNTHIDLYEISNIMGELVQIKHTYSKNMDWLKSVTSEEKTRDNLPSDDWKKHITKDTVYANIYYEYISNKTTLYDNENPVLYYPWVPQEGGDVSEYTINDDLFLMLNRDLCFLGDGEHSCIKHTQDLFNKLDTWGYTYNDLTKKEKKLCDCLLSEPKKLGSIFKIWHVNGDELLHELSDLMSNKPSQDQINKKLGIQ